MVIQCKHIKDNGERCRKPPRKGRELCEMHGGNARRGVDHPNFKHGKYSKDLIPKLQDTYYEELQDPKILEMIDEIAVMRTRMREILKSGESGKHWRDVHTALKELELQFQVGETDEIARELRNLRGVVNQGLHDWRNWDEWFRRAEQVSRIADREHKHRIDKGYAVTHEQMALQLAAVVDIFRRTVKDKESVRAFNRELEILIAANTPSPN